MIFDIVPFRSDKDIGKAYNERIAYLPDDAWIIVRDGDCMYLTPDYGNIIEQIIADHGQEYALIGALTNRLGLTDLLYANEFSEDMDVYNHYRTAMAIKRNNIIKESPICAGFFMMFTKETWIKAGGFDEGTIYADKRFSESVQRIGGKIGIAQNLYLFHCYRIWERKHKQAWNSVEHLK